MCAGGATQSIITICCVPFFISYLDFHFSKCLMINVLRSLGGGEFVLHSDFPEGLGAVLGTFDAVAVGAKAKVGADDLLFAAG